MFKIEESSLRRALHALREDLLLEGKPFSSKRWQGTENPPVFWEVLNASFEAPQYHSAHEARTKIEPQLPWADDHFAERVGGIPYNPPPSAFEWLKKGSTKDYLEEEEKFSHTYPERMWPKDLGAKGIRYSISDLADAAEMLGKDPSTRQCYVPIWFPEDMDASLKGNRVPCTLGWHFIHRDGKLHTLYPMRSCDALRHLHNDLYFANLLTLWMIERSGIDAVPGMLNFHAVNLHCFENDLPVLEKMVDRWKDL